MLGGARRDTVTARGRRPEMIGGGTGRDRLISFDRELDQPISIP
jgi:hypothetical protein